MTAPLTLISYDEALRRCQPADGETGYCFACRVYAPTLPFGGEDEVLCTLCALRLATAHPRLARALEARPRTDVVSLSIELEF
jgi:hypothetical protein